MASRVNWDITNDLIKSPIWPYTGNSREIYKCPADHATVKNNQGQRVPRVRSISMSQVFGRGSWLASSTWRTYDKQSVIVNPTKTWVFVDEHPDSINDAAFANKCDGADKQGSAQIIDMPASFHNGAWFLAPSYNGPWKLITTERVPKPVRAVPASYYRIPPGEGAHAGVASALPGHAKGPKSKKGGED